MPSRRLSSPPSILEEVVAVVPSIASPNTTTTNNHHHNNHRQSTILPPIIGVSAAVSILLFLFRFFSEYPWNSINIDTNGGNSRGRKDEYIFLKTNLSCFFFKLEFPFFGRDLHHYEEGSSSSWTNRRNQSILCSALGGKTGTTASGWDLGVMTISISLSKLNESLQIPSTLNTLGIFFTTSSSASSNEISLRYLKLNSKGKH